MDSQQLSLLLTELQAIAPLPDDKELEAQPEEGSRLVDRYAELIGEIKQATRTHFPIEAIPILLSSFGPGNAGEVYWTTLHLIESFPDRDAVYPLIQEASRHSNPGTRAWCCRLLGRRRTLEDLPFLLERLKDEVAEVRSAALLYGIAAIAQRYALPQALPEVETLLTDEDSSVRSDAREVMAMLQTNR